MANKHKGEVSLQVGSETYTMRLSINAMCNLEDSLKRPIDDIISDLSQGNVNMSTLRAIAHATLTDTHKDITLEAVGEIMSEVGVETVVAKLTESLRASFPEAKVAEKNPKDQK